jgi:hypothetical protein
MIMKTQMTIGVSAFLVVLAASFTSTAFAFRTFPPHGRHATRLIPPAVPDKLEVPEGSRAFLLGQGIGTQNYICMPNDSGFAWTFAGPQATLFNVRDRQNITHFLSPNPSEPSDNPFEEGIPRATWQDSRDTSIVWAMAIASSSDSNFVKPDAIPWLLLEVVGTDTGPTGGNFLTRTTYIHRVLTTGGLVPTTGCDEATDVGTRAFVPYTADYFFYRATGREHGEASSN